MTLTQTLLVQFLLVIPLPFVLFAAFGSRRVVPLAVLQVLIGIALGPSLFGRLMPDLSATIFRPDTLAPLTGLASVAVLLFAFVTGLHVDLSNVRSRAPALSFILAASILVPFASGVVCGFWIAGLDDVAGSHPLTFAMVMGVCTTVTAMPVLGAILREMDLLKHHVGQLALSLAAVNDAVMWVALTLLLAKAGLRGTEPERLLLLPFYLAAMTWLVRPALARTAKRMLTQDGRLRDSALAVIGGVVIGSGLITELMGIDSILGAFLAGAIMPQVLRKPTLDRLDSVTMILLMPFFFVLTGLKTYVDFSSTTFLAVFLVSTLVAVGTKSLSTAGAAFLTGENWRSSLALGSLMQTKGLMEVVILTIFRSAGMISPGIFSALILMSVVCTALTTPLTALALRRSPALSRVSA